MHFLLIQSCNCMVAAAVLLQIHDLMWLGQLDDHGARYSVLSTQHWPLFVLVPVHRLLFFPLDALSRGATGSTVSGLVRWLVVWVCLVGWNWNKWVLLLCFFSGNNISEYASRRPFAFFSAQVKRRDMEASCELMLSSGGGIVAVSGCVLMITYALFILDQDISDSDRMFQLTFLINL
jgi:hypothetical protein